MTQTLIRMRDAEGKLVEALLNGDLDAAALTRLVEEAKAAGLNDRTTPIMDYAQKRIGRVCVLYVPSDIAVFIL